MAEIGFGALAGDLPDRVVLTWHVKSWNDRRNAAGVRAGWQFTTADMRISRRKLYPTIDE